MAATQDRTPLAITQRFLAGIKARDKTSMAALCHPDATACLIRQGKPMHITIAEVLELIDFESEVEQGEVSHDEVEHVDGDFATVWTPYWLYEDGKIHHTGTNNFCLWKSPESGWIITAVQDVARAVKGVDDIQVIGGHGRK